MGCSPEVSVRVGRVCQKVGHSRYLAGRMAQRVELMVSTEAMDDGYGFFFLFF
jgi:hypothetical protein